jgi:hypothetical protein
MTTTNDSSVSYDPFDVDINADPYPTFRRLRDEAPIYYNERYDFWALSRRADVEKGLVDWQVFSSSRGDILEIIQSGMEAPSGVVLWEDPPLQALHRGLLSRVFTPKAMNALEGKVRDYCVKCLDPLAGTDRFDFVADLGAELPMRVIGMLLGIPDADQPTIRKRADDVLRTEPGKPMKVDHGFLAGELFEEYIDWRAEHPSDDLMTKLLTTEFEDERGTTRTLTRQEVLVYTQVLAGAGNETTGRLIGWLGKVLAEHPDQRRELVDDRFADPERHRGDLAFRADGTTCGAVRGARRGVLRHDRAGRERDVDARRRGQPRRTALRAPRPIRHPPGRRPQPHVRLWRPLLPRRGAGSARGSGGARRGAEPVPRVGDRLRQREAGPHVHRAGLGIDARLHPLIRGVGPPVNPEATPLGRRPSRRWA